MYIQTYVRFVTDFGGVSGDKLPFEHKKLTCIKLICSLFIRELYVLNWRGEVA